LPGSYCPTEKSAENRITSTTKCVMTLWPHSNGINPWGSKRPGPNLLSRPPNGE
jgi:hypothetical protein